LGNQVKFHFQKSVWYFKTPFKSDGQNSKRMFENVKENVPSNPSLKFVHNFWLKAWNIKRIFGDEIELDFSSFFSRKFFEKVIVVFLNEVWNSTSNINPAFDLTMTMSGSKAPINSNLHIPHGLFHLLPPHMFIMSLLSQLQTQLWTRLMALGKSKKFSC